MKKGFCGWLGKEAEEKAFKALKKEFIPFVVKGTTASKPGPPPWRYMRRLHGKLPATINQETGDCCSMGAKHAIEYGSAIDIAGRGCNYTFKQVFTPFIYGNSRCAEDCGNFSLGWSQGSTGAWTATACKNYGVLFVDDPGVPKYSGSIAKSWGSKGVPKKYFSIAADNPVKSVARLTTVDQVREALINGFMVTIASTWGFDVSTKAGLKTYVRNPWTPWPHQMCLLYWRDDPFPAVWRQNSWGDSTGPAISDEPLGGAYQEASSLEKEIKSGELELYAYSSFVGFPGIGGGNAFI